jgi:Amt family ammonium transporter
VKFWVRIDDSLDVFAEHAVGGMLGLLANAFFAATYIIGLDGVNANKELYPGGWIGHTWKQLYKQLAFILAAAAWAFTMSSLLAFAINRVPGLHLRATEEAELLGMDDDQLGEFAYDYVEVRRDYLAWTPGTANPAGEGMVDTQYLYGTPAHSEMISPSRIPTIDATDPTAADSNKDQKEREKEKSSEKSLERVEEAAPRSEIASEKGSEKAKADSICTI